MSIESLSMWFPFSIKPDQLIGNIIYTKNCYESILVQMHNGLGVYDGFDTSSKYIGFTVDVDVDRVKVCINEPELVTTLINSKPKLNFCAAVLLEGDCVYLDGGIQQITKAIVNRLAIVPEPIKPQISNLKLDAICREKTCGTPIE